jgi:hypothetical protein
MENNIKWMEEIIDDVPSNKTLFKLFKFILGKRKTGLTYKELYIIYTNMYNFKNTDEIEMKEQALKHILEIYYYNNEKYPI